MMTVLRFSLNGQIYTAGLEVLAVFNLQIAIG